jgi:hypothetical protein
MMAQPRIPQLDTHYDHGGPGHEDPSTPHRELLVAVLRAAIRDLSSSMVSERRDAARFLATNARDYADLLGMPSWLPRAALEFHAYPSTMEWLRTQGLVEEAPMIDDEPRIPASVTALFDVEAIAEPA